MAVQVVQTGLGRGQKVISLNTTNSNLVRTGFTILYWVAVSNINAAVRYLKFYDKATAPTVGTDVPIMVLALPGLATGGFQVLSIPGGANFNLGLGFGLTTGVADNDTGAVAANEIVVNLGVGGN